jgi:hypothetical protein
MKSTPDSNTTTLQSGIGIRAPCDRSQGPQDLPAVAVIMDGDRCAARQAVPAAPAGEDLSDQRTPAVHAPGRLRGTEVEEGHGAILLVRVGLSSHFWRDCDPVAAITACFSCLPAACQIAMISAACSNRLPPADAKP